MIEYPCIVKVISSVDCGYDNCDYGTGIVIANNMVITSQHVVENSSDIKIYYNDSFFTGKICNNTEDYALIVIDDENFSSFHLSEQNQYKFTNEEIIPFDLEWKIIGFLQDSKESFVVAGKGLQRLPCKTEDYNCRAVGLFTNISCDYKGLSGAPIICNDRIIGLVQAQWSDSPAIGFLSADLFFKDIPPGLRSDSFYISDLFTRSNDLCESEIRKNKNSGKYIPEIFVEEQNCKDFLRYFADPILFINKIISDIKNLDFTLINNNLDDKKISFNLDNIIVTPEKFSSVYEGLCSKIKSNIDILTVEEQSSNAVGYDFNVERKKRAIEFNSLKQDLEEIQERLGFVSKRCILLTGKAGSGKTNFLCDFTENFLLKKNIPSLYFNASNFAEKPSIKITDFINNNQKWDLNYVKECLEVLWRERKTFIVIIIDGLNENSTIKDFRFNIEESINDLLKLPYVKILMTTRTELLSERFPNLTNTIFGDQFKILEMPKHHEDKVKNRIIKGYLKHFDVKIIGLVEDEVLSNLIDNFLLLRYFCEVYEGKSHVTFNDMYNYSLFGKYYNKIKENKIIYIPRGDLVFDNLINTISELMIRKEIFAKLPIGNLQASDSTYKLLDDLLDSGVIFSEEIRCKKGFIEEPEQCISFTFDEFRDYCLTNYLLTQNDPIKNFYPIWKKMHEHNWSILEGVEKYVFYVAKTQSRELLSLIIDDENFQEIYWDNIWNFDEESIEEDDIIKWKRYFLEDTPYTFKIASNLLRRLNRNYYKKTSIGLLFDFFNELSLEPGKYHLIVSKLFPYLDRSRKYKNECVVYRNVLLEKLIQNYDIKTHLKDLLRLTIYLYHLQPSETLDLWKRIGVTYTTLVIDILNEYSNFNKKFVFLEQNTQEIINCLKISNPGLYSALNFFDDNKHIYIDIISSINNIWQNE